MSRQSAWRSLFFLAFERSSKTSLYSILRVCGLLCFLLLLVGPLWGLANAQAASAATRVLPYNAGGVSENPPLAAYNAINVRYAPLVQHDPQVYLIFWGPAWKNDTDKVIPQVKSTFAALYASAYNNVLTQYHDYQGNIHNDVRVAASIIDATTPPSNMDIGFETDFGVWNNAQIRHEADKEIAARHWSVNRDSQVIVFPQKGSTYAYGNTFCGVHSYDSTAPSSYAYAEIQYGDRNAGCNPVGNRAKDITWTAVHEYTEMATDPQIFVGLSAGPPWYVAVSSGWHTHDSSKSTPQEIADLCQGYTRSNVSLPDYRSFSLPYLWSNSQHGCVTSR